MDIDQQLGLRTVVELSQGWNGAAHVAGPWNADQESCDNSTRVWCVQD